MRARASRRRRRHRVLKAILGLLTGFLVADALRSRQRLSALTTLEPADPGEDGVTPDYDLVTADGVDVPESVVLAATAHAHRHGLDVVDLVPPGLPAEEALELTALVDPGSYRDDRLAPGRGPFRALLVRRELLARSTVANTERLDPVEFIAAHTELKRLAPSSSDLAVAPGLAVPPRDLQQRLVLIRSLFAGATPVVLAIPPLEWTLIGVGLAVAPPWGAAALAAYLAQPAVATMGTPIQPPDAGPASAARWWREPLRWWRTVTGRWRPLPSPDPVEARRSSYEDELRGGLDRFFEPRRPDCPLCGSADLSVHLTTTDILQYKPGRFTIEACRACGHLFQNPRLSEAGLDFYYRDFYDGLGEEPSELVFGASDRSYRGRAEMLRGRADPSTWLDVGAGHGHFCLVAGATWPNTRFDGLDLSDSIDEAARRGWVARGYRGMFPDLAADLSGAYDVVSMHHYLEHTRDPIAELDAAAVVLAPGGHLLIEVPDPESGFGRALGRWWIPWFQPQHQHFLSVRNLERALVERGFEVVACERGEAHQTVDLVIALWLWLNTLAPPPMPWLPPQTRFQRWRRPIVLALGGPFLLAAALIDQAIGPVVRVRGGSNTYRMLAAKPPG